MPAPNSLKNVAAIPHKDICEALGINAAVLRKRIAEGIYPTPKRDQQSNRYIYTLGWLDIAQIREAELKQILINVEQRKLERERRAREIVDILGV